MKDYPNTPSQRPSRPSLEVGKINYTAEQINALLELIPLKVDREDLNQLISFTSDNFIGHYPDASMLTDQKSFAWAFVGDLAAAVPYFHYMDGYAPKGYGPGWNNMQHIFGTYPLFTDNREDQLTAEELFKVPFRLPELTADRALADEHGNRIPDTYVTRQGLTEHIRATYNKQFLENPPLITEGYITPGMLSEETRQMLEATGQQITNLPDGEDLQTVHGVLKLANKEYNPGAYSGLGRQYLRKNIVAGRNVLTQSMISKPNTIYIIQYDYDLQGAEITIPENCVLDFQGGRLSNGIIVGTGTTLKSEPILIFHNCELSGVWHTIESYPEWFGLKNTSNINKCFKYFSSCVILRGDYVYDETIIIPVYSYIESIGLCTIDANGIDGVVMEINHYGNSIKLDSTTILVDKNRTSDVIVIKGGSGSEDTDNRAKKCRLELPFVASNAGHWKEDEAPCSAFVFDLPNGNYIIETEFLLRAKAVKNAVYIKKGKGSSFMSNVNFIIYSWWNNYCLRLESGTITAGGLYFYLFSQPSNRSLKIIHIDDDSTRGSYNRMNWRFDVVPWDMQFFQDYSAGTTEVIDWCVGWDMKNVLTTETRLSTYFTNKHLWNNESEACKRDDLVHSTNTITSLWYIYYKIFAGIASDADRDTALVTTINNIIKIGYDYSFDLLLPPLNAQYMSSTYYNRFRLLFGDNFNYDGYAKIKIIKENISSGYFKSLIFNTEGSVKYYEHFTITTENGVCTKVTSTKKQIEQILPQFTNTNSISSYSTEINKGRSIFIENAGVPVWFNGKDWVNSEGYKALSKKGITANRPSLDATQYGFHYYDTNLKKPIWWTGEKWVDAAGTEV